MRRLVVCLLFFISATAMLMSVPGCGGSSGGGGGFGGAPRLFSLPVQWIDTDNSATINGGDQLVFRFDRDVIHTGGDPSVEVDVFGLGAIAPGSTWANGPTAGDVTATLAGGSSLQPGIVGPKSLLNMGANTIVNPADPGAGGAVPALVDASIVAHVSALSQNVGTGGCRAIAARNFDGDAQIELVIGKTGTNEVFQSVAYGVFQGPTVPSVAGDPALDTRSIAVGNVDGDGNLDYVTGNFDGANYVYKGDGFANFFHVPAATPSLNQLGSSPSRFVFLAQWDGALGLDLFVANNGTNYIYFGDGTGQFDGPAPGQLAGVTDRLTFPGGAADTRAAVVGEWNNDFAATPDIITVDDPGSGLPAVITQHILTPNAPGTAPSIASTAFPVGALASPRSAARIFADADGIPDLIVGYAGGGGMQVWLQNPIGTWTLAQTVPGGDVHALETTLDFNGDAFPDVVQGRANNQPDYVFLNAGFGNFIWSGLGLGSTSTFDIAPLDADGVSLLDFVTAGAPANAVWVTAK